MDIFEAIGQRRSVRHYTGEPVKREDLLRVLDAARLAPSWKNTQNWRYVVLSDRERIMELGEAVGYNPNRAAYENAAHIIVLCADAANAEDWEGKQYYMTDMGIGLEHFILAATALGLGTCWIGAFPEENVKNLLHIPDGFRVVALTPLGVPAKQSKPRPRKELAEIAYDGEWGRPIQP